jgi:hypothetical protein
MRCCRSWPPSTYVSIPFQKNSIFRWKKCMKSTKCMFQNGAIKFWNCHRRCTTSSCLDQSTTDFDIQPCVSALLSFGAARLSK